MPAVWPATLPQRLRSEGYEESPPDTVIRTPMETGPAKVRQRFTAGARPIKGTIRVTFAQRDVLDAFYVTTLKGGALPFDWLHPTLQTPATLRFTRKPTYSAYNRNRLSVRLELEILP